MHTAAYESFLQFLYQLLFSRIFLCVLCIKKNNFILIFAKLEFYEVEKF